VRHVPGSVRVGAAWGLAIPYLLLSHPTWFSLLSGVVLGASGLIVRGWAAGSIDKSRSLATTGPYAHTRNPLYLGSFLIGIGLGVAGGHWIWPLAFLVLFTLIYVPTIRNEAARMGELFGPPYAEYAARVPAFVPRATPYRGSSADEGRFEWRRYLRHREWEAILGVAVVFGILMIKMRLPG
jgi:protein-S-isoprenylcysteine O-methyltransferase Ste14